jgi:hypothetical protein
VPRKATSHPFATTLSHGQEAPCHNVGAFLSKKLSLFLMASEAGWGLLS